MTDEAFVFQQDVRERSKMKTGAYHRKNGSRSKKCTLPSDRLTQSQKNKLNGECSCIKLNEPYHSWNDFKKLSVDVQRAYISNLVNVYHGRFKDIAEMFNVSSVTFSKHCCRFNPPVKSIPLRSMDEKWLDFITSPAPAEGPSLDIVAYEEPQKKTDEEIIKEVFGVDVTKKVVEKTEIAVESVEEKPVEVEKKLYKPVEDSVVLVGKVIPEESVVLGRASEEVVEEASTLVEKPKKTSGYSSMVRMDLTLKGSKEEIMAMLDAILGDDFNYKMILKINNITIPDNDREDNANG